MNPLYICLLCLGGIFLLFIFPFLLISTVIYVILLVRTSKKKWSRTCSWENEEQQRMFDEGKKWGDENEPFRKQVSIKSGRFKLVGEYFDFGSDKAVIIIPGRMESGTYSYYFSEPYKKAGYNVLAIDNRSHGLSDGVFNTLGIKEYKDILRWGEFLHSKFSIGEIVIHALCIGSATGLYALISPECPDYFKGMVADGMYTDFSESFKNHLKEKKKPIFPTNILVMGWISLICGKNIVKHGPINCIDKLKKPILFLYSKEDAYSTPDKAQLLYDKANQPKKIVWFDKGVHSHVRINAEEKYDETIASFLREYI